MKSQLLLHTHPTKNRIYADGVAQGPRRAEGCAGWATTEAYILPHQYLIFFKTYQKHSKVTNCHRQLGIGQPNGLCTPRADLTVADLTVADRPVDSARFDASITILGTRHHSGQAQRSYLSRLLRCSHPPPPPPPSPKKRLCLA